MVVFSGAGDANHYTENKRSSNTYPIENWGWTQVLLKGKKFHEMPLAYNYILCSIRRTWLILRRARVVQWVNVVGLPNNSYKPSPIRRGFASCFVNYKKGCTRLAAASDTVYQLLVHGRWFSPGTPASSTNKTGRHDIAEILLKVTLNTINQIKSNPTTR